MEWPRTIVKALIKALEAIVVEDIPRTSNDACPPIDARPMPNTICLFDLDGTLCPDKQASVTPFYLQRSGDSILILS